MSGLPTLLDVPAHDRRLMTRKESETFVVATMAGLQGKDEARSAAELDEEFADAPLAVRIAVKRLRLAEPSLRFSTMTLLFVCSLCETPARVVLWAYYLVRRSYALEKVVDATVLAEDFPFGFPTDEGMSRIWDAQKRADAPCGNALDSAWPWQRADHAEAAA